MKAGSLSSAAVKSAMNDHILSKTMRRVCTVAQAFD
jgi:hypothetical protein